MHSGQTRDESRTRARGAREHTEIDTIFRGGENVNPTVSTS
jgi:hypothetical protein